MKESSFPLSKIHLPENKIVVGRLQKLSLLAAISVVIIAAVMLLISSNLWLVIIAFILIAVASLVEIKLNIFSNTEKLSKFQRSFFLLVSVFCSGLVFLIGIIQIFNNSVAEGNGVGIGLSLILISIAFGLVRIKNTNRFYFINLLVLIVLTINSVAFLGNFYQIFSPAKLHLTYMSFSFSAIFVLLCISILLRWPDRGFVGIFTTDSISSKFSLRLLFINLTVTFVMGIIILIGMKNESFSTFEVLAVLIILFMVLSSILAWINLKLLYRYELERFIMKEELRVHNITVNLNNEDLTGKMTELEGRNKEIADKLSSRSKLMDINENLP
jgi:hypothetical protein